MGKVITYKKSGVDIDKADRFIDAIIPIIKTTKRPELLGDIGGFSGLFRPNFRKFKDPVLVASTDGVGTKVMLTNVIKKYDTVGIDLVAMCVNDIITCGAEPLFFLDYFATSAIELTKSVAIMRGIVEGCRQANCALIGGETAEMPGLYPKEEFDLAGFCVGIVDKNKIITGDSVKIGDVILGIESSGLHSNGFSLVRKVFTKNEILNTSLKRELLKPTIIYVKPILDILKKVNVKSIANITGGGFYENIPRVIPKGAAIIINKNSWMMPAIFKLIQRKAGVSDREMYRTLNMGIGIVLILSKNDVSKTKNILLNHKLKSWVIGEVIRGKKEVIIE